MKPFMFTAEETNLMCIFSMDSREAMLSELRESLGFVYEPEMREIIDSTIEKLGAISDEDFSEIGFYVADEYAEGEDWLIGG